MFKNRTLEQLKVKVTTFMFLMLIIENILFFGLENFFASVSLFMGWLLLKTFVFTSYNFRTFPVSFLMLFGLSFFHYVLPVPLTLIELKPVTFNMNVPYLTFLHHFLFIVVIIFTFKLYTNITRGRNIFRSVLNRTEFYKIPTNRIIWITSILGFVSTYYLYFIFGQWQSEVTDRNFFSYTAQIFAQFLWMPLVILFSKYRKGILKMSYSTKRNIIIYSLFVFIIAIASNMRTLVFSGLMIFIFLYLIGILNEFYNIKELINPKRLLIILIIVFAFSGPVVDFAYAMVIVRQERYELKASDFIEKTISVYQDKELIEKAKNTSLIVADGKNLMIKEWDENYLSNPLFNRFSNLKIADNCQYYAEKMGYQNQKMQTELVFQIEALLPNFLLQQFGLSLEKKTEFSSYSLTDYFYSEATNNPYVKGSFIIGNMTGIGMALFGYSYLLVLIPIFFILFYMFDSFVNIKKGKIIYSYFFFVTLLTIVNYFNDRHVYTFEIRYIFRTYFESIVSFLIIMKLVRFIELLFFKSNKNNILQYKE